MAQGNQDWNAGEPLSERSHSPTILVMTQEKDMRMTACPRCAARFSAAPSVEEQWLLRHISRSHGINRMKRVADSHARDARRELDPAA